MTDDRLERALSEAIADLAGSSKPTYLNDILERTSKTRQRPWWTFPGRYLSMTPTLKFATAAGLAFVLGIGLAPLVLPSGDNGAAPPGATSPSASPEPIEYVEPVEFEARGSNGPDIPGGEEGAIPGGPDTFRDIGWRPANVESSDSRLEGQISLMLSGDEYPAARGLTLWNSALRIENDDGAWQQRPSSILVFAGEAEPVPWMAVFDGEGAYEGLAAVMSLSRRASGWDVRGVILDGRLPPDPGPVPSVD